MFIGHSSINICLPQKNIDKGARITIKSYKSHKKEVSL